MKRYIFRVIFLILVPSLLMADTVSVASAESYNYGQYFISDPPPEAITLEGNPLKYALKKIGLDPDTLRLPRAYENNYRTVARLPIIDYVSENPFYMRVWADETAHRIIKGHRANGVSSAGVMLSILRGTSTFSGTSTVPEIDPKQWLEENSADWPFTPQYKNILTDLLFKLIIAKIEISSAKKTLGEEDRAFFASNPGYYLVPDGSRMPSLTGNVETHLNFIRRARKLDLSRILSASEAVAVAVQDYYRKTLEMEAHDVFYRGQDTTAVFTYDTPIGVVTIAGYGNDVHKRDAALSIDLGGNDTYSNNAGGCDSPENDIAVCIDHAGDDTYDSGDRKYVQGFGLLGAGILADFEGDDTCCAGHFAQGGAILGLGCLWDLSGNDRFHAGAFCQGAGMFGLGALLDDSGDDLYDCATLGQGSAMTLGMGILSDLDGDDWYRLAVGENKDTLGRLPGYGQGGALSFRQYPWKGALTPYGGVGILVDAAGNDDYKSNGWCDQGGSYILSLGVLYDGAGNDRYDSHTGQGSGIHITNAILIDKSGNDYYHGEFRAGGSGGDRSPGFLLDYGGDDIYDSKTSSYGTGVKPYCLSLFVDFKGDDHYICSEPEGKITFNSWDSFGGVWPESEPYNWPYAIALDLSGNDKYDVRNHANNSERHGFGHGIHLDAEWSGDDLFDEIEQPLEPYTRLPLPDSVHASRYASLFNSLQSPDTFERFVTVEKLINAGPDIIPSIMEILDQSNHRQYNRDLLEVVHCLLAEHSLSDGDIRYLTRAIKSSDPEVRTVIADDSRVWGLNLSEKELTRTALEDPEANVRLYALKSLLDVKSKIGLEAAKELTVVDPSPMVRYQAVEYIGMVAEKDDFLLLSLLMRDEKSPIVRVAIAETLGRTGNPEAIPILKNLSDTDDYYLIRAVGKSLCELHQIEGIKLLIESLAFPSIDAFENYNRNIPNLIAAYAGHDLPENRRYRREEWLGWYKENKDKIDIVGNVDAYNDYRWFRDSLRVLSPEREIARYETFLENHPGNIHAKDALAEKLNHTAWDMVTAPKNSPVHDPVKGLEYARRATQLKRDPNYFDTYIEALTANGEIDTALRITRDMLELYPDNRMFKERLEKIKKISRESN